MIICHTPELAKPNTIAFELMAQRLDLKPNELMYVGDHPKNDVDASRRAGYTPVWVRTIPNWVLEDMEKCELQVDTIEELPELIKNGV